jgi:hypothetical protein
MSVSQVKKRFGEMEAYLRNDKEGLRRLKLVKDDVNVLRTSLASAIEAKETAEVIKDAARDRADVAEEERDTLRIELHNLKQHSHSLVMRLAETIHKLESQQQDQNDDEDDEEDDCDDHREAKKVLNALRKRLPSCPKLTSNESSRHNPAFIRQEISKGWSHSSIWTLGAAVAIIAAHEGAVTIVDPIGTTWICNEKRPTKGMIGSLIRWFGNNFKVSDEPRRRVYIGNTKPAELIDPCASDVSESISRKGTW